MIEKVDAFKGREMCFVVPVVSSAVFAGVCGVYMSNPEDLTCFVSRCAVLRFFNAVIYLFSFNASIVFVIFNMDK